MSLRGEAQPESQHRSRLGANAERGFTAAFELVATPALFGLIGYFLDARLGTGRLLTVGLAVLVAGYLIWKLWYQYTTEMVKLEAELIADRTGGSRLGADDR